MDPRPKHYVVTFPDTRRKPRVVRGWKAISRLRARGRIRFRGFHSESAARSHVGNVVRGGKKLPDGKRPKPAHS